jgi:putative transposase
VPEVRHQRGDILQCRRQKKYDGLGTAELRRLRQLEDENLRLKQIVADLTLDK